MSLESVLPFLWEYLSIGDIFRLQQCVPDFESRELSEILRSRLNLKRRMTMSLVRKHIEGKKRCRECGVTNSSKTRLPKCPPMNVSQTVAKYLPKNHVNCW